MKTYEVAFIKNGVCQCNLVESNKSVDEIRALFKKYKRCERVLGVHPADADAFRPDKPIIEI